MTGRVTDEDLDTAILWLENNEGGGFEQAACRRVAEWLKAEQEDRQIRKIMRDGKVNREAAKIVLTRLRSEKN
jgi:hypothetical protein